MPYYTNEAAEEIMRDNPDEECIICGEYAPYGILCKDCYYEMKDFEDDFLEQDYDYSEINDYYYNLNNKTYRTNNEDYIYENCIKLLALANLAYDEYEKSSLLFKAREDVEDIIYKKIINKYEYDNKKYNNYHGIIFFIPATLKKYA